MSCCDRTDVVIVGGGLIGAACALELHRAGVRVVLCDGAGDARAASRAAAGMLAPHHELELNHGAASPAALALWQLGCASLEAWPAFAAQLGIAIDLAGGLQPLIDDRDADANEQRHAWLHRQGIATELVSADVLRQREPALRSPRGALWLPGGRVDPRLALDALRAHLETAGVPCVTADVLSIDVHGVETSQGRIAAALTVLASGAWTPALAALSGLDLRGEPVKGQMLRFACNAELLRHFVHSHHAYLVPRPGQGVVVGSTMVRSGFDMSEDDEATARLRDGARRLCPALADVPVAETWTGLRPRLHGGLPCIARPLPHLIVATGHFRNGVLLTPITATLVLQVVLAQTPSIDLTPFASACPA